LRAGAGAALHQTAASAVFRMPSVLAHACPRNHCSLGVKSQDPIAIQEQIMRLPELAAIRSGSCRAGVTAWALLAFVAIPLSQPAVAHHGWAWAEDEQSTLAGKIQSISMTAPHPTLQVTDAAGATWQVDLGNPGQTARSGFTADSAQAGDAITVLGNRNRDRGRNHMKAVRITIDGRKFDLYPERITPN
jgi:hypothetical protein